MPLLAYIFIHINPLGLEIWSPNNIKIVVTFSLVKQISTLINRIWEHRLISKNNVIEYSDNRTS